MHMRATLFEVDFTALPSSVFALVPVIYDESLLPVSEAQDSGEGCDAVFFALYLA